MKYLLTLMTSLKITDSMLTDRFVRQGTVQEGNPLVASIVSNGSFISLTVTGALLCVLALWLLYRRFPRLAGITASCVTVFYGGVIAWNLSLLLAA